MLYKRTKKTAHRCVWSVVCVQLGLNCVSIMLLRLQILTLCTMCLQSLLIYMLISTLIYFTQYLITG